MSKFKSFYCAKIDAPILSASSAVANIGWRTVRLPPQNMQLLLLLTSITFLVAASSLFTVFAVQEWNRALQLGMVGVLCFASVLWIRVVYLVCKATWTWTAQAYLQETRNASVSRDTCWKERMFLVGVVLFLLLVSLLRLDGVLQGALNCAFVGHVCLCMISYLSAAEPPRQDEDTRSQSKGVPSKDSTPASTR